MPFQLGQELCSLLLRLVEIAGLWLQVRIIVQALAGGYIPFALKAGLTECGARSKMGGKTASQSWPRVTLSENDTQ